MRYLPMLVPGTNGSVRKAKPAASAGDNGRGSINATPPSLQENHVQRTHQPETGSSTEGECCENVLGSPLSAGGGWVGAKGQSAAYRDVTGVQEQSLRSATSDARI